MATVCLSERRIDALKPRKSAYDVRDRELKGFGVRVLTSGVRRYFIHSQHNGRRFWKIVGQAGAIDLDEARSRARTLLAAIRNGSGDETTAPPDIVFETVAEEVFRRYAPELETVDPQRQPGLLQEPDPALVRGAPDRRHRRERRPAMVRLPLQNPRWRQTARPLSCPSS